MQLRGATSGAVGKTICNRKYKYLIYKYKNHTVHPQRIHNSTTKVQFYTITMRLR